ncbi:hypothetical protein NMG60_11001837 [Bertholletia excelsa]
MYCTSQVGLQLFPQRGLHRLPRAFSVLEVGFATYISMKAVLQLTCCLYYRRAVSTFKNLGVKDLPCSF